ncbi:MULTISPECIES: hypothetical protein [unclassified Mycolicibacterium]|uniref:hypothetical protein n=1 Tax=unclassified Mycolicibacterium TaxID=2636767 RepID=UPI002ED8553A
MPTAKELRKLWDQRIKDECKARGLRFVGGSGFQADAVYLSVFSASRWATKGEAVPRWRWTATIKPLVLDEILWAAFMPDEDLGGPLKRLNLRVNGWFAVDGLDVGSGFVEVPDPAQPGTAVAVMLDEFERARSEFVAAHPDVATYLKAAQSLPAEQAGWPRNRLREILTLIAVGDRDAAGALADAELAGGEHGPMSGPRGSVFELLSVFCKPADVQAEYWEKVKPTHRLTLVSGTSGQFTVTLAAGRERSGSFDRRLRKFNGRDDFALILTPIGDEDTYLQAAGSGPDRITLEIRKPGGQQWGVESVRYVIGRPGPDGAALDQPIELPNSTQMVSAAEIFDADEASALFTDFYRAGALPETCALRPAEGWTADGTNVDLR